MKTIEFPKKPQARAAPENVDKWMEDQAVDGAGDPAPPPASPVVITEKTPSPKMKRLTIDIPDNLHRRVKSRCGQDGLRMADVIRELLEKRFPNSL